jgi:ribosome-associated protein
MLIVNDRIQIPLRELEWSFARSSGSGGQNVNKVNSKAILSWRPLVSPSLPVDVRDRFLARFGKRLSHDGSLQIQSDRFRDQPRNIDDCMEKLRLMILEVAIPPKKRKRTKPTRAAREKRLDKKRRQSDKKRDRRNWPE